MNEDLEKRLAQLEHELQAAKHDAADRQAKRRPNPRSKSRMRSSIIAIILVLTLILGVTAYVIHSRNDTSASQTSNSKVDLKQVANQAGFEVYFPMVLPQGFTFDPNTVKLSGGVMIYSVTIPNGAQVIVTQQAKPPNFNYNSINTDKAFTTLYGVANVYEQGDKTMASLVSKTTWLVCNSTKGIGYKAMEDILQSLRTP